MPENQLLQLPRIRTRGPLAEKVYLILKEAIVTGKFELGMWLQEEALTSALNVSRTPVREALNRLKSDGLVEISPRKGAHIIDLSDSELGQLFEAREKVETVFFIRSARTLSTTAVNRFWRRLEKSEKSMRQNVSDRQAWNKARREYLKNDRALHDTLIRAAGNTFWEATYYRIRDRIEIFGNQISFDQEWFDVAIEDHYRILEAIKGGDCRGGRLAMQKHIRNVHKGLVRIRQQRPLPATVTDQGGGAEGGPQATRAPLRR